MCSNCDCGSKKGQVKESSFQVNQVNGQLIEMDDRSPGRPSCNSKTLCLMWTWGTTNKKNEVNLKKKDPRDWNEVNLENKERKKMRGTAVMMADLALILLGITSRCYFFQPHKIFIGWILSFLILYIFRTERALVFKAVKQGQSYRCTIRPVCSAFCSEAPVSVLLFGSCYLLLGRVRQPFKDKVQEKYWPNKLTSGASISQEKAN